MDQNYHKDLSHIRHMMERSTRFLSLSGMSGIVAGVIALLGAAYAYNYLGATGLDYEGRSLHTVEDKVTHLIFVALLVLVSAIFFGGLFTCRNIKSPISPSGQLPLKTIVQFLCSFSLWRIILYRTCYSSILYINCTNDVVCIWSSIV